MTNFEIKANVITKVQQIIYLDSLQDEDPNAHIANILETCDTFKVDKVFDDTL